MPHPRTTQCCGRRWSWIDAAMLPGYGGCACGVAISLFQGSDIGTGIFAGTALVLAVAHGTARKYADLSQVITLYSETLEENERIIEAQTQSANILRADLDRLAEIYHESEEDNVQLKNEATLLGQRAGQMEREEESLRSNVNDLTQINREMAQKLKTACSLEASLAEQVEAFSKANVAFGSTVDLAAETIAQAEISIDGHLQSFAEEFQARTDAGRDALEKATPLLQQSEKALKQEESLFQQGVERFDADAKLLSSQTRCLDDEHRQDEDQIAALKAELDELISLTRRQAEELATKQANLDKEYEQIQAMREEIHNERRELMSDGSISSLEDISHQLRDSINRLHPMEERRDL